MRALEFLQHRLARWFVYFESRQHGYSSYLIAIALMALALWLRLLIAPVDAGLQYLTFFPAVTLAAILGGYRAGLCATLIGLGLATFIFTPPYYALSLDALRHSLWSNLVFLADGLIISLAIQAMHRNRQRFVLSLELLEQTNLDLQSGKSNVQRIIDNLFSYVALLDQHGVVVEMNKAPLERSGLRREDVIGQHFKDGPWWAYNEAVQRQLVEAINDAAAGRTQRYDVEVKMGDDLIVIDFQISPVYDESHTLVGLLSNAVEITHRKEKERELSEVTERLLLATRAGGVGVWDWDLTSNVLNWDEQMYALYGISARQFTGAYAAWRAGVHPEDLTRGDQEIQLALRGEKEFDTEFRICWPDGTIHTIRALANVKRDEAGRPLRMIGTNWDITEQKLIENELRIAAATFESHDAIMIVDANERILRVNQAFESITGYGADEAIGQTPRMLSSKRHDQAFFAEMWSQILGTGFWEGEIWDRRKNGDIYPKRLTITAIKNTSGEIAEYVGIFSDISERKQSESEIQSLAFFDPLTKLPNRRLLMDRLRQAINASDRNPYGNALLFIDLDNFKTLNDTKGHETGDQLLRQSAGRILTCVRESDTVARLGGDEFVVILTQLDSDRVRAANQTKEVGRKILEQLNLPYKLVDEEYLCSASIGITLFDGRECIEDELMKQADIAMYQAKSAGRNALRFFDPEMQKSISNRVELERELRKAITLEQLQLYYQIQYTNERQPLGAEALIRWIHPERGMVSPMQFIPIAEASTLIKDIGNWVLETACRQLSRWAENELTEPLILAINVSARQFAMPDFVGTVEKAIQTCRINPSRLKLELTESVIVNDISEVVAKMHALKALGVRLSLDDFGTGYSSLSYLKRLPIDQLKIDQSFVRDVLSDQNDAVMVKTIIDMAKNFGLNVIAEGVETQGQLEFLEQNGCLAYQGYLFSKPVPLDAFEALLRQ